MMHIELYDKIKILPNKFWPQDCSYDKKSGFVCKSSYLGFNDGTILHPQIVRKLVEHNIICYLLLSGNKLDISCQHNNFVVALNGSEKVGQGILDTLIQCITRKENNAEILG